MNFMEVSDVAWILIEDKSINRSSKAIKMPVDKRITPATASTAAPGRPISAAVNCVVVVVVVVVDDDDDGDDGDGDDIIPNRNRSETLTVSVNSSMKSQTESKNVTSLCSTIPCRISLSVHLRRY